MAALTSRRRPVFCFEKPFAALGATAPHRTGIFPVSARGNAGAGTRAGLRGLLAILLLSCAGGCTRELTYSAVRSDGTRETWTYRNVGFDTKAGRLVVSKAGERINVEVENLTSEAKALQVAGEALELLKAAGAGGAK